MDWSRKHLGLGCDNWVRGAIRRARGINTGLTELLSQVAYYHLEAPNFETGEPRFTLWSGFNYVPTLKDSTNRLLFTVLGEGDTAVLKVQTERKFLHVQHLELRYPMRDVPISFLQARRLPSSEDVADVEKFVYRFLLDIIPQKIEALARMIQSIDWLQNVERFDRGLTLHYPQGSVQIIVNEQDFEFMTATPYSYSHNFFDDRVGWMMGRYKYDLASSPSMGLNLSREDFTYEGIQDSFIIKIQRAVDRLKRPPHLFPE